MNKTDTKSHLSERITPPIGRERQISALESILFASGEPVYIRDIKRVLGVFTDELDEIIKLMKEKYDSAQSGLILSITEDTLQLETKPDNYEYIKQALSLEKRSTLTKAGSEVLAILAYAAPLTRLEIDQIRGVNSAGALQRLIDQGVVEECGRREVPGRPFLYQTTDLFLRLAGLKSLKEMPSFDSFKQQVENREIQTNE